MATLVQGTAANQYTQYASAQAWTNWTTASVNTCSITTNASSNASSTIWINWNDSASWNDYRVFAAREPTQAELAAKEERKRKLAERQERARKLLEEVLDEQQQRELEEHRYFTVHSRTSKRRYRVKVNAGVHGNVEEIDHEGRVIASLCCAPEGGIPKDDAFVGQKLWLEHDDEGFRRVANITRRRAA